MNTATGSLAILSASVFAINVLPTSALGQEKIAEFKGHFRGIHCVTFLDSDTIVTGGLMSGIQVWRADQKKAINSFDQKVRGLNIQFVIPSQNGGVISLRKGSSLRPPFARHAVWLMNWNLSKKKWVKRTIFPGHCLAISEKGKYILQRNDFNYFLGEPKKKGPGYDTKSATLYELATKKKIMVLEDHNKGLTYAAAISKDNKLVATVSGDNWISIWDLKKKQKVRILNGRETVHKICFSPDGRSLYSCHHGQGLVHHLQKWDIDREKSLWRIKLPRDFTKSVRVSPDGQKVAVCCGVRVYFYAAGNGVPMLLGPLPGPAFAFSRDGRRFATGDMHGNIAIWEFAK